MHEKHRERVRKRFENEGLEGFVDHNVLELLLFYSVPRKDTNETAHRLLEAFGSLDRVFDAPYERLLSVDGIGENSAVLLSMIPQLCKRYLSLKDVKRPMLLDRQEMKNYVRNKFLGINEEIFYMLCLDGNGCLINCCRIGEGGADSVLVDKRALLETAFRCNAQTVILAHNHPNGIAAPSRDDISATLDFIELFTAVGIRVNDHCIVGDGEVVSLAESEKFKSMFF